MSPTSQRIMSICNCIAAGIFLGTCFNGLVPHVREEFLNLLNEVGVRPVYALTEITVVLGFFLILFIEKLIHACQKRSEHVPVHAHEMTDIHTDLPDGYIASPEESSEDEIDDSNERKTLMKKDTNLHGTNKTRAVKSHSHGHTHSHGGGHSHMPHINDHGSIIGSLVLMCALSIHGLFEGMALALQTSVDSVISLFIAVIAHESLCAFAMGFNFSKQKLKICTILKLSLVFASVIPIGIGMGMGLGEIHGFTGKVVSAVLQGIAAGTFLHVIFLEMIPPELNEGEDQMLKVLFLFIGYLIMAGVSFVHLGHSDSMEMHG